MSTDNLKFRVWDNDEKRYRDDDVIAGTFLLSAEGKLVNWNDYDRNLHSVEKSRFLVEQCTGLEDKDGEPIYEGDVLEMTCHVFLEEFKVERLAVEYSQMIARWRLGKSFIYLNTDIAAECKIVGNIHQNAEDSKK